MDQVFFKDATTGVTVYKYETPPARRVKFYVISPRNNPRNYQEAKEAIRAARGFVKRWNNESKFWDREYAIQD